MKKRDLRTSAWLVASVLCAGCIEGASDGEDLDINAGDVAQGAGIAATATFSGKENGFCPKEAQCPAHCKSLGMVQQEWSKKVHCGNQTWEDKPGVVVHKRSFTEYCACEHPVETPSVLLAPPHCPATPACDLTIDVSTTPSLVLTRQTHAALLDAHFTLDAVFTHVLSQANVNGQTATDLYQRLWDTQNTQASGRFTDLFQPHCDDPLMGQPLNDFPVACRPGSGAQADTPITTFTPVALFNRFDLAPKNGSHCGEYRIVYANNSNTSFIILEAQLPNPSPECGVETCRPVAEFWASLSTEPTTMGNQLRAFYFDGLSGFRPVIHPNNYGLTNSSLCNTSSCGGQIRTNDVLNFPWHLDEFQLGRHDDYGIATLYHRRVPVKANPFGQLFSTSISDPRAAEFQNDFVSFSLAEPSNVERLAASTLSGIGMSILPEHNANQSEAPGPFDDYLFQFGSGANSFQSGIQSELNRIGSSLTPGDIVRRALTQSCAGCHHLSNNADLGDGLTWPSSLSFFHVSRSGALSPALNNTFLPHRKAVLEEFLRSCAPSVSNVASSSNSGYGASPSHDSQLLQGDMGTLGGSFTH